MRIRMNLHRFGTDWIEPNMELFAIPKKMNKTKIKNQTHDEDDGDVIGFEGKGLRKI